VTSSRLPSLPIPTVVIADMLPDTGERLPSDWALHDPADYIDVLERGIASVLAEAPGAAHM